MTDPVDHPPVADAIKRSIHAFVSARSTFAVSYVDPQLDAMADQLIKDLLAFSYKIVDISHEPLPAPKWEKMG